MRRNKLGLADLKKLKQPDPPPEATASATRPERVARKRAPFLPPSPAPLMPKASGAAAAASRAKGASPVSSKGSASKAAGRPGADVEKPALQASGARGTSVPPTPVLDESDRRLFLSAVRSVERIKDPGRVVLAPVPLAPDAILEERRKRAAGLTTEKPARRKPSSGQDGAAATQKANPGQKAKPGLPEAGSQRPLSDAYVPAAHDADDRQYLRPGHGSDILRDLKRGKWPIGASLDLHGSTLEDARERFERFVDSCLTHDVKCVRIVHGKGYGSRNGDAVLKSSVRRWLVQMNEVMAYVECAEADGGSGAVQVLLK